MQRLVQLIHYPFSLAIVYPFTIKWVLTVPIYPQADRDRRKQEQMERKQASRKLLEEEEAQLGTGGKSKTAAPTKVTRAEIEATQALQRTERKKAAATSLPKGVVEDTVVDENPNLLLRQRQLEGEEQARTVDEAIAVLGKAKEPVDMHPEKRLKAAYAAFEERELPRLRAENPNLRLSQLKQMLRKDWMKSPDNPMNQYWVSWYW